MIVDNHFQILNTYEVCQNTIDISENIFVSGDPGISCNNLNSFVKLYKSTGLELSNKANYEILCNTFYKDTCASLNLNLVEAVQDYRTFVEFTAKTHNLEIDNIYDFKMWQHLNFRYISNVYWMLVNMPKVLSKNAKGKTYWDTHFIAFYHTDLFQIWDYQNKADGLEYVRKEGDPKYYKPHHKKLISSVYDDLNYMLYKAKVASLRPESMSWQKLSYIDNEYLPHWRNEKNAMA